MSLRFSFDDRQSAPWRVVGGRLGIGRRRRRDDDQHVSQAREVDVGRDLDVLVVVAPPPAADPDPASHHTPGRGVAVIK